MEKFIFILTTSAFKGNILGFEERRKEKRRKK